MPIHNYVLRDRFERREVAAVTKSDPKDFREAVIRSYIGLPPKNAGDPEPFVPERIVKRVEADVILAQHGTPVSLQNVVEVPEV